MSRSRRQAWLAGLLGVAFLAFLAQRFGAFGGALVFGGPAGAEFDSALETEVADLDLDRLARGGAAYTPGRDPWRFEEPPPPPRLAPPPVEQPAFVEPPPAPVQVAPPRPQPPAVDIQYLGRFGPIAVFVDQNGETLYNALEGEVLKGKFQVAQIGLESVQIAFVGFPDAPPAKLAVHGAGR
jgi:hypothetical protein